jgi:hypothetical protein
MQGPTMKFSASPMGCLWVRVLLKEATVRGETEARRVPASGGRDGLYRRAEPGSAA